MEGGNTDTKSRIMFIFPGQGSQYKGMGSDIYNEFKSAKKIYEIASEALGIDMAELSFKDPKEELNKTEFTQPAVLTHSIACLSALNELTQGELKPHVLAGHSLGEYSALVAANSINLEDALKLVHKRGQLMNDHGKGKLFVVKGEVETIKPIASKFHCDIAVHNSPDQIVVGGTDKDADNFAKYLKSEFKLRAFDLGSKGAFHTYHMTNVAEELKPFLEFVRIKQPKKNVLSNYSADYHGFDEKSVSTNLFFQIFNKVRWYECMKKAMEDGVNTIIEIGGGIGEKSSPDEKRPNLATITERIISENPKNTIYFPAINTRTIKNTVKYLNLVSTLPEDSYDTLEQSNQGGNRMCDNHFHLYVPAKEGMISNEAMKYIDKVHSMGIEQVVQFIKHPAEKLKSLAEEFGYEITEKDVLLMKTIECDMAGVSGFCRKDLDDELEDIKKRFDYNREIAVKK